MVGDRIKRLREEKGLSVAEFARRVGIPVGRLEEIERGGIEPCDATLVYISKLFGVSFWWLKEGRKEVAEVV